MAAVASRVWGKVGAVSGSLAVGLGAYGAHGERRTRLRDVYVVSRDKHLHCLTH